LSRLTSSRGESTNPKRDIPIAVIGSILRGIVIYIALQVVCLLSLPASSIGSIWSQVSTGLFSAFTGPWAQLASLLGFGWLATTCYGTRSSRRPIPV
jgi:amino acid transporter